MNSIVLWVKINPDITRLRDEFLEDLTVARGVRGGCAAMERPASK